LIPLAITREFILKGDFALMSRTQKPVQLPQEMTSEVIDGTGDIAAFRALNPSAVIQAGRGDNDAQFDRAERNTREAFGNYSGISNPLARSRALSSALDDISYDRALTNANINAQGLQAEMTQKAALADLTAKRRQYGYSSVLPPQSQTGSALIGAAGAIGSAALKSAPAIIAA
jgi:hypothetical protein